VPQPGDGVRNDGLTLLHCDHACPLDERRRAGCVVLEQLREVGYERRRRHDPAEPPSGHQPRLRERVRADHAIVGLRQIEERRRGRAFRAAFEVEPLVGVVGDDPDPVPAAVREDRALRFGRQRPPGRVVRRIDVHRARSGLERCEQSIDIERPPVSAEGELHAVDARAEDFRDLDEVRPERLPTTSCALTTSCDAPPRPLPTRLGSARNAAATPSLESCRISHNRRDVGKRLSRCGSFRLLGKPAFTVNSREGLPQVRLEAWRVAKGAVQDGFHGCLVGCSIAARAVRRVRDCKRFGGARRGHPMRTHPKRRRNEASVR